MTRSTDLPTALPIAIATALLLLILAPWLGGGGEPDGCRQVAASSVAAAGDQPTGQGGCDD
jgi:hypothetical protein